MTRYLFTRIGGSGPTGVIGQATVSGWGADPIVDALKAVLLEREGSVSDGVYGYFCLEDPTGLERGRIKLGAAEATLLNR